MARIFITGSSTGLGLMAAKLLIEQGHRVVLHGRNQTRAKEAMAGAPGADAAVVGDLSSVSDMKSLADPVNRLGRFDAVIHNADVGDQETRRLETADRVPHVFAVNVLAPFVPNAVGRALKPMPKASSTTWCSPLPSLAFGRLCARMRSSRVGSPHAWVDLARPTT
jgi:NAD(P)-dependent dehydrogenase (short-subunit alcohol dehydrogenase family)